jgi:hypothetical protein
LPICKNCGLCTIPTAKPKKNSLKQYRDLKNSLDTAELDGFAKAEQHFLPQLEEERRQKEDARKKILDLAKFLKQMGMPTDQISEKTGLGKEEIEGL